MYNNDLGTDLQMARTITSIRNAFIYLLSQKDFQDITVADICQQAFLKTDTFYEHYFDTHDLLNNICELISDSFLKMIVGQQEESLRYLDIYRLFYDFLLRGNSPKLPYPLPQNHTYLIHDIDKIISQRMKSELTAYPHINLQKVTNITDFITSGLDGSYHAWYNSDRDISLKEIADQISDLINDGFKKNRYFTFFDK